MNGFLLLVFSREEGEELAGEKCEFVYMESCDESGVCFESRDDGSEIIKGLIDCEIS